MDNHLCTVDANWIKQAPYWTTIFILNENDEPVEIQVYGSVYDYTADLRGALDEQGNMISLKPWDRMKGERALIDSVMGE